MSELISMVVPLQTLPGWPVAPPVHWFHALGLFLFLPLCAIVIIVVIGKVGHQLRLKRGGHDYDEDPLTQEGRAAGIEGGGSGARAALPAQLGGETLDAEQGTPAEASKVGGARARW